MTMTKICLVNPPTTPSDSQLYFPMALVALGSFLKKHGIDFEILDLDLRLRGDQTLRNWPRLKSETIDQIAQSQAPVIGISSICSNFPFAILLAEEIRRVFPTKRIIMGGPHPSAVPEETLRSFPFIDAVAIGEGEQTLVELMSSDWQISSLEKIQGLAIRDGDRVIRTAKRQLIDNLDDLPFPDYSLISIPDYLTGTTKISELTLIEAGRGCPFLCSFCSTSLMWERQFRIKSPERILEEMRKLSKEYGVNTFGLTHDNFTTSHSYVSKICKYFEENNTENFKWYISGRSDTLNSERLQSLHRAGCYGIFMGVDSGSDRIQKKIQKHLNLEQFRDILTEALSLQFSVTTSFIVGYPDESEEELNKTIQLGLWAKMMGASRVEAQFHYLEPLPGTVLYEENRSQLAWHPRMSVNRCYQPFQSHEADDLIAQYPDLFSSFYCIPTPLGPTNVLPLSVFYNKLINDMAPSLARLLDVTHYTPTELFLHWMEWRENKYPDRRIDEPFVLGTFSEFLKTCLWRSRSQQAVSSAVGSSIQKKIPSIGGMQSAI